MVAGTTSGDQGGEGQRPAGGGGVLPGRCAGGAWAAGPNGRVGLAQIMGVGADDGVADRGAQSGHGGGRLGQPRQAGDARAALARALGGELGDDAGGPRQTAGMRGQHREDARTGRRVPGGQPRAGEDRPGPRGRRQPGAAVATDAQRPDRSADPTGQLDQFTERGAVRHLDDTRYPHRPGHGDQGGARVVHGAEGTEPAGTPAGDRREMGECLHVVDEGGPSADTDLGQRQPVRVRPRGTAGHRRGQRRRLPGQVGRGRLVYPCRAPVPSGHLALRQRPPDGLRTRARLDIDDGLAGADRLCRQRQPVQDEMGRPDQQGVASLALSGSPSAALAITIGGPTTRAVRRPDPTGAPRRAVSSTVASLRQVGKAAPP